MEYGRLSETEERGETWLKVDTYKGYQSMDKEDFMLFYFDLSRDIELKK